MWCDEKVNNKSSGRDAGNRHQINGAKIKLWENLQDEIKNLLNFVSYNGNSDDQHVNTKKPIETETSLS